ncbi:hypothetical protein, partial [Arthrobacter tecti]
RFSDDSPSTQGCARTGPSVISKTRPPASAVRGEASLVDSLSTVTNNWLLVCLVIFIVSQ